MSIKDKNEDVTIDFPLTFHTSKKNLYFLLILIMLIACGLLYCSIKTGNIWCILSTVFLSLVVMGIVKQLKNPMTLEVTEIGLLLPNKGIFSTKVPEILPWKDIEGFGTLNVGFNQYVTYQFTKESGRRRLPGGYMISIIFEAPAEEIAMLLEGIRQGSLQHEISGIVFRE